MSESTENRAEEKKAEPEKKSFPEMVKEHVESGRARILSLEDDAKKFARTLLEKGRASQAEGKKRLDELSAKVRDNAALKQALAFRKELEEKFGGRLDKLLEALGLPSREDVQKLQLKLDSLSKRVGDLTERVRSYRRKPRK